MKKLFYSFIYLLMTICIILTSSQSITIKNDNNETNFTANTVYTNAETFSPTNTVNTYLSGIDVSSWQGTINWASVKNTGVQFAMLRICSLENGTYVVDSQFVANINGAKAQGIHIGAYFYSYATNLAEVKEEAKMIVDILDDYPATFDFPIVFDAEDPTIQSFAADACNTFCSILEKNGYYAMIYANTNWFNNVIKPASAISSYALWHASYYNKYTGYTPTQSTSIASEKPALNANNENVKIWQYTDKGSVSGISGNVDMNVGYYDFSTIIRSQGYNNFCSFTTLKTDINNHWYECICGKKKDVTLHSYTTQKNDSNTHWYECFCGAKSEKMTHNYNLIHNETNHFDKCIDCNYVKNSSTAQHNFNKQGYNSTEHYMQCECGLIEQSSIKAHTPTYHISGNEHWADCECGYVVVERSEHDYTIKKSNTTQHWGICVCGTVSEKSDHDFINTYCLHCGYHVHNYNFTTDETTHDGDCKNCDFEILEEHTFSNGVCTICEYVDETYTPPQGEDNTNNDDNLGESSSSCQMAIGANFPIYTISFLSIFSATFLIIKRLSKRKN